MDSDGLKRLGGGNCSVVFSHQIIHGIAVNNLVDIKRTGGKDNEK